MDVDVLIIGSGVVGLACTAALARAGCAALSVERHGSFGQETSSRNSEVIHSGIYYPAGSWKAKLCVEGNRLMYEECARLGVWNRRCGKLVVAVTDDEVPELRKLYERGERNGVEGLQLLSQEEAKRREPAIRCLAALLVPSTGIVDSHELMKAYAGEAAQHGATLAYGVQFLRGERQRAAGYKVILRESSGEETAIEARTVVNAAGLQAERVAASFGIDVDAAGYRLYPNRGHYYRVAAARSRLVSGLVYPIPPRHKEGLGIHITVDRAGQVKLGPDNEYINPAVPPHEWYRFDDSRKERFYEAVSRYFPALLSEDLSADQVGVRPKLQQPGGEPRDFVIQEEHDRGLPGLINLLGIESPGLTCAGVIARQVARLANA